MNGKLDAIAGNPVCIKAFSLTACSKLSWTYETGNSSILIASFANGMWSQNKSFERRMEVHSDGTLTIRKVETEDSGLYTANGVVSTCKTTGESELSRSTAKAFQLNMHLTVFEKEACRPHSSKFSLKCVGWDDTELQTRWFLNKSLLKSSETHKVKGSALEVLDYPKENSVYTCRISKVTNTTKSGSQDLSYCTVKAVVISVLLSILCAAVTAAHCMERKQRAQ
ncbi:carcinoembryonic antigen-related cell adhesion molecule 15-like isoform X2 [Protopterus annectens]|nr:carcinoembryonic antigen-related cell adhesion molecule 15-like isoform X2 [Protopterus annectens]